MGKIIAISGRSGVGKTTVAYALESDWMQSEIIKSYTTRPPRDGDKNDYIYLSKSEFENRYDSFIYAVKVHENYYGTLRNDIQNAINSGKYYTLVVSIETMLDICESYRDNTIGIFLTAPSEVVRQRLNARESDSDKVEIRLKEGESWEEKARNESKVPIHFINASGELTDVLLEVKKVLELSR